MPRVFSQTKGSSGGAASDLLSVLTAAPIAVTGATTATIGRMHYCTGTSANYSLMLPPLSGNKRKHIGVMMGTPSELTKLVTVDGDGTEKINQALTRIMWANEVAILECPEDESEWKKIMGLTIPMVGRFSRSSDQTGIIATTWTPITLNQQDSGCAFLWDSGAGAATFVRPNPVHVAYGCYLSNVTTFGLISAALNSSVNVAPQQTFQQSTAIAGGVAIGAGAGHFVVAVGDHIYLTVYGDSAGSITALAAGVISLSVAEIPQW